MNELKESKNQLPSEFQEKENILIKKILHLEGDTNDLQIKFREIETQNKENAEKNFKYKGKLKNAISLINDINNILAGYTSKSEACDKGCQTSNER